MIFQIYGYGLSPIKRPDTERVIKLPDVDTLIAAYDKAINGKASKISEKPAEKKPTCEKPSNPYAFRSILANHKKNAFTVAWEDGTYTVIHLQPGDNWDDEKALAMCIVKKMNGNKGSFNDIFTTEMPAKIKRVGEPVEEKHECNCETPCANCSCHAEAEKAAEASVDAVLNKMSEAAEKANATMKKMIDELVGEPVNVQRYDLFLMDPCGDKVEIYHQGTDEEIQRAMRAYRKKHYPTLEANRTPYRVWMIKDNLMVDFGTGSYFMVPGMDHDTFVKGK